MIYTLTIGWLYPELMSTYGDRGNIICLAKRCEWRGIKVEVKHLNVGFSHKQLAICDMLFMGGAQDRQQKIVAQDLKKKAKVLEEMMENGIPGLFICGAYQFLGKYYKPAKGAEIPGLGILDLYTEHPGDNAVRLIGNIVVKPGSWFMVDGRDTMNNELQAKRTDNYLIGFENHGGRTYLGKGVQPLGKVIVGYGNNGEDKTEGAVYKNAFGTYLHGPILPKNPHFADYLIQLALKRKYGKVDLPELDDSLEWQAHKTILNRLKASEGL